MDATRSSTRRSTRGPGRMHASTTTAFVPAGASAWHLRKARSARSGHAELQLRRFAAR
jgi:hypothetical protein